VSPLPERRKTPEELAELRESLGISAAPEKTPEAEKDDLQAAVFSPPAESESALPESTAETEPTIHSLRKSARLPVDQPKPQKSQGGGALPTRRHTDEELMRLRRMQSTATGAAIEDLGRKTLSTPGLVLGYTAVGLAAVLLMLDAWWLTRTPILDLPFDWLRSFVEVEWHALSMKAGIGGLAGGGLLFAGWIAWRRPLSRHHAGFLTIMAMLVLVFATLYFFPNLHGT
jgi:hypothetical protein